jgi:inner membrane protein
MATILTHGIVAATLGGFYSKKGLPWRFGAVAVLCSILPDIDVLGFALGIHYGDFWGHRGFTHSLLFAAIVSAVVVAAFSRELEPRPRRVRLFIFLFAVTASHGLLDALTDGGLGVAFFSPFDTTRYFFPWRPIPVSPIGAGFFSRWGWEVLRAEVIQVWSLCLLIWIAERFLVSSRRRIE